MTQYLPCDLSVPESKRRPAKKDFFKIAVTKKFIGYYCLDDKNDTILENFDEHAVDYGQQEHPEDFNL